jgi:uncharacterized membrane protein
MLLRSRGVDSDRAGLGWTPTPDERTETPLATDPRWLDALPRKKGFRMRGMATTRIETFTDAAFALALSLLVLTADVPTSYAELLEALRGIPSFVLSATLLMMFWSGHHTFSRRYGLEDGPTIVLSCLLVFTVLVYVYPLRFMLEAMLVWFGWILGLWTEPPSIGLEASQVNSLFVIYGAGFLAMCGTIILLNVRAWRLRDELALDPLERFDTRSEIQAWSLVASAGVVSSLLALVLPRSSVGLPGWAYSLLALVMPWFSTRVARRRRSLVAREP